jgi:RNA polymerase sigma-70 factor (ECF subfamily)
MSKPSTNSEFEELALVHLPKLYRLAYARLGSKEDAEDIVQESYLKAFRAFGQWRDGNFPGWLTTIMINTLRDHKRKIAKSAGSLSLDEFENADHLEALEDPSPRPDQHLEEQELDADLEHALRSTPDWMLTPFLLREVQDMSYKEIAQALSIPIGTVMSRLSRARQHLSSKLSGRGSAHDAQDKNQLAQPDPENHQAEGQL